MLYPSMNSTAVNIMTLTGTGEVTTTPDLAVLRLGVETTGEPLTDIQNENARISQAVLNSLRDLNVTDINTYQYLINKRYEYEDGKQIDKGYSVRNIFEIKSNDINNIGTIIDTAVNNGANVVDFIDFQVSDTSFYYNRALDLAIKNAYQKAILVSHSLGIANTPVPIRITEVGTPPMVSIDFARQESAVATPIEPGTKQVKASVVIKFLY